MTHADIINLWPSLAVFAEDVAVHYGTAKAMRRRGSIPAELWVLVVDGAANRGIEGITFESLARPIARSLAHDTSSVGAQS